MTEAALHDLRLRGLVRGAESAELDSLCDAGLAQRKGDVVVVTSAGRAADDQWARLPDGSAEAAAAQRAYDQFGPLNDELLAASSAWQVRTGNVPNDHADVHYDWQVIDRLAALDERAGPVLRRLGGAVARFERYRPRLAHALERVQDGEHDWFVSPSVDSYHTVWMQLHEDLLLALGLSRESERR